MKKGKESGKTRVITWAVNTFARERSRKGRGIYIYIYPRRGQRGKQALSPSRNVSGVQHKGFLLAGLQRATASQAAAVAAAASYPFRIF